MKLKTPNHSNAGKWLPGVLATAAGATAANAATVQITLGNNYVQNALHGGTTYFSSDLTGDDEDDSLFGVTSTVGAGVIVPGFGYLAKALRTSSGGKNAYVGAANLVGDGSVRNLVPFSFSDERINGGRGTNGFLDMTAKMEGSLYEVRLNRLIFDDLSTTAPAGITTATTGLDEWSEVSAVPEPSAGLALLALGAGGLLTRRRTQRAA